jgi:outer membrane autotransporter protein
MKKIVLLFITTAFIGSATQSIGITLVPNENEFRSSPALYLLNNANSPHRVAGPAFGYPAANRNQNYTSINSDEISTVSDGSGFFSYGGLTGDTTLNLTNNVSGFINYYWVDGNLAREGTYNSRLTIDATAGGLVDGDDPNISSVTGSKSPDHRIPWKNDPSYALFVNNRHGNARAIGNLTLIEGNYFGDQDMGAASISDMRTVNIYGSSMIGGNTTLGAVGYFDQKATVPAETAHMVDGRYIHFTYINGLAVNTVSAAYPMSMVISNKTSGLSKNGIKDNFGGLLFHDAMIGGDNTGTITAQSAVSQAISGSAGHGIMMATGGTVDLEGRAGDYAALTIMGGDFLGGYSSANVFVGPGDSGASENVAVFAEGGSGVLKTMTGTTTLTAGQFAGGNSGTVEINADNSSAHASGGRGIWLNKASSSIDNAVFSGGRAGQALITGTNGLAFAYGGNGIQLSAGGSATINNTIASSSDGGVAIVTGDAGEANAMGGNGVYADGATVTIDGGTYSGARGGIAIAEKANADGGSGVRVENGTLNINGGIFYGAAAGTATGTDATARAGRGVFAIDSTVTIGATPSTNIVINDGIYFSNTSKKLDIKAGTVNGEILLDGTGTTTLEVSSLATNNGTIVQNGGTVNVTLNGADAAATFFKDVTIDGKMDFGSDFISGAGSTLTLINANSEAEFNALALNDGSRLQAGYGLVDVAGGNLAIGNGSSVSFSYAGWTTNATSPMFGRSTVGGSLVMSNGSARLSIAGATATPTGSVEVVSAGGATDFGSNNPYEAIQADFGWLVQTNNIDSTAGITIDFEYKSLTNGGLSDLGTDLLTDLDELVTNSTFVNSKKFYMLNDLDQNDGEQLLRYTVTQMPDVADAAFQVQQQVSEQIAARGTEFRSMNGFASSKPTFGMTSPMGAAGPAEKENNMQGWIRAYGSFAERDAGDTFTDYESDVYGTVIGIDKSFGSLLVGLAGGYASGDIDAGSTYEAEVDTYHGTLYSTIGGKSSYVDLAFTYGINKIEADNILTDEKFDSHTASGYIGAGKSFNVKEKIKFTPEASILLSYYTQEEYDRFIGVTVEEYDEWSYLGSLGASIASTHQIDWLSLAMAVVPELRLHWLHEFNPDLEDFSYVGTDQTFGVRSREEDLLKVGVGFDMWSWKRQNIKFELDYDGIFGSDYEQHVVSGKVTVNF